MNILLNLGADDWNCVCEAEEQFDGMEMLQVNRTTTACFIDLWTLLTEQPSYYASPMKYCYFVVVVRCTSTGAHLLNAET